jgi:thiamine-monophosphate kinase
VSAWSERELVERIRIGSKGNYPDVLLSIGDDCCELATGASSLISTDTLVESVHFDLSFHPPYLLGRKSIAVNLSDIAAMGGVPRFVLLSLCLPEELEQEWINEWLDGALCMLHEYDCVLVGGDTVKGRQLVLSITVLGEALPCGAVYRSGACEGDSVWVSGVLGAAGAGLALLSYEKKYPGSVNASSYQSLCEAHLNPTPQVALGQALARSGFVTAMQDISDGLATDLAHLCKASGVRADIAGDALPMMPETATAADFLGLQVDDLLLRAGEDYQLVFTVRAGAENEFAVLMEEQKQRLTQIGTIIAGSGVFMQKHSKTIEISFQGYEH